MTLSLTLLILTAGTMERARCFPFLFFVLPVPIFSEDIPFSDSFPGKTEILLFKMLGRFVLVLWKAIQNNSADIFTVEEFKISSIK